MNGVDSCEICVYKRGGRLVCCDDNGEVSGVLIVEEKSRRNGVK